MGSSMWDTVGSTGRTKTVRRRVPAVDEALAKALGRPAPAHTLIEHFEEVKVLMSPEYPGPSETLHWVLAHQEREGVGE